MRSRFCRFPRRLATVFGAGFYLFWTLAAPLGSGLPTQAPRGGSAAPALTAFKDPASGRFVAPQAGAAAAAGRLQLRGLDRSQAGLVEQPGETAAGGVRLDLQGRFASALVARRDATGHLALDCTTAPPAPSPPAGGTPAAETAGPLAEPPERDRG